MFCVFLNKWEMQQESLKGTHKYNKCGLSVVAIKKL